MVKEGSFSYQGAAIQYSIYGDNIFGYTAKMSVSFDDKYVNIPFGSERAFVRVGEVEKAIDEFSRDLVDSYIVMKEKEMATE